MAASRGARFLGLAAAPTFALMALSTGAFGHQPDVVCMTTQVPSPLSGMTAMSLLMSAFHLGPWLELVSRRPVAPGPWSICRAR
jgi:hypothetical protein